MVCCATTRFVSTSTRGRARKASIHEIIQRPGAGDVGRNCVYTPSEKRAPAEVCVRRSLGESSDTLPRLFLIARIIGNPRISKSRGRVRRNSGINRRAEGAPGRFDGMPTFRPSGTHIITSDVRCSEKLGPVSAVPSPSSSASDRWVLTSSGNVTCFKLNPLGCECRSGRLPRLKGTKPIPSSSQAGNTSSSG